MARSLYEIKKESCFPDASIRNQLSFFISQTASSFLRIHCFPFSFSHGFLVPFLHRLFAADLENRTTATGTPIRK